MTRFFNAYISSLSSSISWGGDGGSCQLTLVEDPEDGVSIRLPATGSPVYIEIGRFYFGGIFQRVSYKESLSGRTYDVVIESPAKFLDGIQVILSDFNGTIYSQADPLYPSSAPTFTNQLYNIYNPFAHEENYQQGGFFGRSNVNSAGFPAVRALQLIQQISTGGSVFGGPARFGNHLYTINLSEIINALGSSDFRLSGPVQNLNSIIQECCEIAGLDYFVELRGGKDSNDIISNPEIYIRTVSRGFQPSLGAVESYVEQSKNSGLLVSSDIGYEFSSPLTQKLVIGGSASRFLIQDISTTIPVWGKTSNNTYLYQPDLESTPTVYSDPTYKLPILIDEFTGAANYFASIFELRMAMGGKDTWETFKMFESIYGVEVNGFNNIFTAPWVGKIEADSNIINFLLTGQTVSIDLDSTSSYSALKRILPQAEELSSRLYSAVSRVANNFFGQVFLMELQYYEPGGVGNNLRFIQDDIQYESAWDISEAAFTTEKPFADVAFYDGDGRLKAGASWPSDPRYDYSALGSDWAITPDGGIATNKGGPDKDVYWINNVPYVIVRSGGQILSYDSLTTADLGLGVLVYLFTGIWIDPAYYLTAGSQNVQIQIPPQAVPPTSFGIPQESNRYSWGPWWAWSGTSPGKSEVVKDDSLRPETFGSLSLLDSVGYATATIGLSQAAQNETGSVEVVGVPVFNIADRFSGAGPYVTGIDINIGVDGEKVTYKFNTWTPSFGKLTKTNIDRIQKINKGTLALAQKQRSEIQKKPLPKIRFEKSDFAELAERYKRNSPTMFHSFINEVGRLL
jgi:hypothetical protein